jgi:hypothetical protein
MAATMARPELEGNRRAGLFPRLLKTFIEVFTEVIHRCRYGDHRGTTIAGVPIIIGEMCSCWHPGLGREHADSVVSQFEEAIVDDRPRLLGEKQRVIQRGAELRQKPHMEKLVAFVESLRRHENKVCIPDFTHGTAGRAQTHSFCLRSRVRWQQLLDLSVGIMMTAPRKIFSSL